MQAGEGDLAIFLKSRAHEIEFENEKFLIVPHAAILLLIRDDHHPGVMATIMKGSKMGVIPHLMRDLLFLL